MQDGPMSKTADQPNNEPKLHTLQVNGISMRVAEQGSGPLVLFCHGWPESW